MQISASAEEIHDLARRKQVEPTVEQPNATMPAATAPLEETLKQALDLIRHLPLTRTLQDSTIYVTEPYPDTSYIPTKITENSLESTDNWQAVATLLRARTWPDLSAAKNCLTDLFGSPERAGTWIQRFREVGSLVQKPDGNWAVTT